MKILQIASAQYDASKPGAEVSSLIRSVNETMKDRDCVVRWMQSSLIQAAGPSHIVLTAIVMEKGT